MLEPSRRRFVAGLGSTAATLAVAGCLQDGGDAGGDGSTTDPTSTGTATARQTTEGGDQARSTPLQRWVPTPAALGTEKVSFYHADLAALRELRDSLPAGLFDGAVRALVTGGRDPIVPSDRLRSAVAIQTVGTTLVRTDMGDEELGAAVVDAGYEATGSHGDATVYESTGSAGVTVAVRDGVVVRGFRSETAPLVETVLDAGTGEAPRLVAENDDIATLSERTADADVRVLGTNPAAATGGGGGLLSGAEALAYAWQFGSEETTFSAVATYPEGSMPATAEFASYLESDATPPAYTDFEASVDGRVVRGTGTLATAEFSLFGGGSNTGSGSDPVPRAQFSFDYDGDAETVTIVHDGGDAIEASRLAIEVDGVDEPVAFAPDGETVSAGSQVTVDVSDVDSGAEIRLVWSSSDGMKQVIATFVLP